MKELIEGMEACVMQAIKDMAIVQKYARPGYTLRLKEIQGRIWAMEDTIILARELSPAATSMEPSPC